MGRDSPVTLQRKPYSSRRRTGDRQNLHGNLPVLKTGGFWEERPFWRNTSNMTAGSSKDSDDRNDHRSRPCTAAAKIAPSSRNRVHPEEVVRLCPAFVLQVGDDVLSGHRSRFFSKECHSLANVGFVMPLFPMPIAICLCAREGIEPAVDFFIGLAKQPDRPLTV